MRESDICMVYQTCIGYSSASAAWYPTSTVNRSICARRPPDPKGDFHTPPAAPPRLVLAMPGARCWLSLFACAAGFSGPARRAGDPDGKARGDLELTSTGECAWLQWPRWESRVPAHGLHVQYMCSRPVPPPALVLFTVSGLASVVGSVVHTAVRTCTGR